MSALTKIESRHACSHQADKCRAMGSSFIGAVLDAVDRNLLHAPVTSEIVIGWTGNPAAAAVALRVNGALHALARQGTPDRLASLYRREHDDFDGAVVAALSQHDQFIADWIRHPTQTNEVARSAAIMAALMAIPLGRAMPVALLELGSSCGLNLNLARYAHRLGGVRAGEPQSPVRIEPQWRGASPPDASVSIVSAEGVDLHPLQASNAGDRERLLSFTWADQPARARRLEDALQMAVEHAPSVHEGDARVWLAERLAEPQPAGQCRVVVHTMFLQYLNEADRQHITSMMVSAGQKATPDRPLAWIGFEWTSDRREVELRLTSWPRGESRVLAKCHPYGDWIEWLG